MPEHQKKRLVVLFWLVVAVIILPPILFGEARGIEGQTGGDRWRNFIYDFQTLIGGGAAIIAAWYTVRQMRITDEKSETRHRELVGLQLRADRLRVERLLIPALADLEDAYKKIAEINPSAAQGDLDSAPQNARLVIENLSRECQIAISILNRKQFKDAEDLFDGDLAYRYGITCDELSNMEGACDACITDFERMKSAQNNAALVKRVFDWLQEDFEGIQKFQRKLLISFADLNVCLELMKKEYGIHI